MSHWSGRGFRMRLRVVKLLFKYSLTLCRVADADQGKTAANFPSWILGGCRLVHARRNTAHHFPPEHAGFVEYENLRVLQICLQVHELLGVLQFLEQPWVKPLDETVYGSGVEADVERRGASGGCHSDELANEA